MAILSQWQGSLTCNLKNKMFKYHTCLVEPFGIKRNTDSSSEPVSLAEAKAHLRVTHTDDDAYITTLITACRQSLEISTRRSLGSAQSYTAYYQRFPTKYYKLVIPKPPYVSFQGLKYYNNLENLTTVSTDEYLIEESGEGTAYLAMKDGFSTPTLSMSRVSPVYAEFTAGYTTLPKPLHQAILLLVAHYYDTREPISFGDIPHKIARTVDFISEQYKIRKF